MILARLCRLNMLIIIMINGSRQRRRFTLQTGDYIM